jgi:hypothetical protein
MLIVFASEICQFLSSDFENIRRCRGVNTRKFVAFYLYTSCGGLITESHFVALTCFFCISRVRTLHVTHALLLLHAQFGACSVSVACVALLNTLRFPAAQRRVRTCSPCSPCSNAACHACVALAPREVWSVQCFGRVCSVAQHAALSRCTASRLFALHCTALHRVLTH